MKNCQRHHELFRVVAKEIQLCKEIQKVVAHARRKILTLQWPTIVVVRSVFVSKQIPSEFFFVEIQNYCIEVLSLY